MTPERILETRNGTGHALDEDEWVALCDLALKGLQDEAMRWIPVSERLPEGPTDVLVCSWSGRVYVESSDMVRRLYDAAKVNNEQGFYLHWMPLPAAPVDLAQALNERKET